MAYESLAGLLMLCPLAFAAGPYVGSEACARCHRQIATLQAQSNMAQSWQQVAAAPLAVSEGDLAWRVNSAGWHVTLPGRPPVSVPIESMVGGRRHGRSFLVRLKEIGGLPLARAPLIEARYLDQAGALVLSPGFPAERPASYETAIGRPLSPGFEKRCLSCHGAPQLSPSGEAGIRCEHCHGPGRPHLDSIAAGRPGGIVNPANLSSEKVLELCGQCHAGFSELIDPLPEDLLVSNQVTALRNSECYVQSGAGLNCLSCHDPHRNAVRGDPKVVATCLSCHAAAAKKAATCPVNARENCIGCHMPAEKHGSFELVDHWIRVHPQRGAPAARARSDTHVVPRRVFLKIIVVDDRTQAEAIRKQLLDGASFFDLARRVSSDPSAAAGGFLGEMWPEKMDPLLGTAAARLAPGELSDILAAHGRFILLERLPRDFRGRAAALEAQGKYEEALRINPYLLRALVLLGASAGRAGDRQRAVAVLEQAALLYPRDPSARYNLGIAYGAAGRPGDEIDAYRRAIELEPDLAPAYTNLGAALLALGRRDEAAEVFRRVLDVNPLSATAYYNLGLVLEQQGKSEDARRALRLAALIDPRFSEPRP